MYYLEAKFCIVKKIVNEGKQTNTSVVYWFIEIIVFFTRQEFTLFFSKVYFVLSWKKLMHQCNDCTVECTLKKNILNTKGIEK